MENATSEIGEELARAGERAGLSLDGLAQLLETVARFGPAAVLAVKEVLVQASSPGMAVEDAIATYTGSGAQDLFLATLQALAAAKRAVAERG